VGAKSLGFFLSSAPCTASNAQSLAHRVVWIGLLASSNSTSCPPTASTHDQDDSSPGNAARLLQLPASRSRDQLSSLLEAAFYLLAGVVRTYAPCGETPALKVFQTRDPLSVISGISTAGHLVTLTRTQALTGQESITFLHLLHGYLGRRLLVVHLPRNSYTMAKPFKWAMQASL
jgi:hypothetical protein